MATKKEDALNYLNFEYNKNYKIFLKQLSNMIKYAIDGKYSVDIINDSKFDNDFKELYESIKDIKVDFIPYSEITRIMYGNEINANTAGMESFFYKFDHAISESIKSNVASGDNITACYEILIKVSEDIKLADKQLKSLYKQLADQLAEQSNTINQQTAMIEKQFQNFEEKNDKLKIQLKEQNDRQRDTISQQTAMIYGQFQNFEEKNDMLKAQLKEQSIAQDKQFKKQQDRTTKIDNSIKKIEAIKSSIYGDFITILGIFAAIIFTLFGGVKISAIVVKQLTTKANLWRGGIILTIFGIIIFCLMSFLMESIAMITGKISIDFDEREHCWQRHPFWTVLKILVFILIICIIGACITKAL
ncbi:hypothetical protein OZX69_08460 [Lactobacillus sp. ESL0731]|uniref:hypothetical protein n=1 Tax=unclassified Lactobacillus TaxID=2620435 RepID=UPI0023FA37AF|nr:MULTISPECIES: hypothetical protein [unclassified Lactobacillus]WEV50966.1 hypothetical protein OZX63_08455 [Lactobacillus sp. ESL0700]WEV62097.1 hypothetical protein OZX69_08460 [Lactobacillus sp. ESL0731]